MSDSEKLPAIFPLHTHTNARLVPVENVLQKKSLAEFFAAIIELDAFDEIQSGRWLVITSERYLWDVEVSRGAGRHELRGEPLTCASQ